MLKNILFLISLFLCYQLSHGQERSTRTTRTSASTPATTKVNETSTTETLNSIEQAIATMTADKNLINASVSFYAYDMDNNVVLAELDPDRSLVTASTMKVVTTATALQLYGSYHKFKTTIQYEGYIDSLCTLHGDIYIKGGGDPTLGSRFFTKKGKDIMQEWVHAIANLGIHQIDGRIIGDASYFSDEYVPPTWGWGDMGNYYGAGVSGLTIYDNLVRYIFNAGNSNNDSTNIVCYEPYTPDLFIDNRVKAGDIKKDEAYIFGAPYDTYRVIRGRIPKGAKDFEVKGAMHDPAYVAAFGLEAKLWEMGISVTQSATTVRKLKMYGLYHASDTSRREVLTIKSPSLSKIVYWTNLISNNLFAEHLLKHIGVKKYGNGTVFSSTVAVKKYWTNKGVNMMGFYVNDGSGLSRANAVSAKQLVGILKYMSKSSKYSKTFKSSLPIAGKTGTLKNVGRNTKIQGNLRAKSGTMSRVKSYAGYVTTASGKHLAFAIIANNFNCTTGVMRKKMEKVMVAMGNYYK